MACMKEAGCPRFFWVDENSAALANCSSALKALSKFRLIKLIWSVVPGLT